METKELYGDKNAEPIRPICLRPFKEWEQPLPSEVRSAVKLAGLTGSELASLVGITSSRSVRRWVSGDAPIPYAAWAILCHKAGFGIIWV